jgi:hypothetical protein
VGVVPRLCRVWTTAGACAVTGATLDASHCVTRVTAR